MTITWRATLGSLLLVLAAGGAWGQPPRLEKAAVELALDRTAYLSGDSVTVGARMAIEPGWHVNANPPSLENLIPTELAITPPPGWAEAGVDYPAGELQTFGFSDHPLSVYDGEIFLLAQLPIPPGQDQGEVPLAIELTYQACDDSSCLPPVTTAHELVVHIGPGGEPADEELFSAALASRSDEARTSHAGGGAGGSSEASLAVVLALALLGGLILNAMPCVLPILSLKVFGMVKSAGGGRRAVTVGSLATAAGILVSFWALAAAAIAAKAAGSAVGWGIQFQNPAFVTFLALVVVLFSLNLWGLFEIPLPGGLARLGSGGARDGLGGHFASGLFATLMATPCSAPFLGTAVGFALGQSAPVIAAVFTAVGLGMALPYLALAAAPGAARLLPKPGPWMDIFKGVMGFLLAGAAVWLLYVLSAQVTPERLAAIEVGLLLVGLFVWLRHRGRGALTRRLAAAGAAVALVGTLVLPMAAEARADATAERSLAAAGLIDWQPFAEARAEELAAAGTPVFVDVTADWCFTCKFNEKVVLETEEVAAAFDRHGVVAMKADWTNRDQVIGDYLAAFDRYGIPFYALYRPGAEPHVFGELLTKSAVVDALAGGS